VSQMLSHWHFRGACLSVYCRCFAAARRPKVVWRRAFWALSHESACFRAQLSPSPVELLMLMPRSGGRNEVSVVKNALVSDHWVAKGCTLSKHRCIFEAT